jgi:hypothetical protein
MNGRFVPGESCPRRRHTSPAAARCTPHRLKPSRRGPSRLILHPQRTRDPWSGSRAAGPVKPSWRPKGSCALCHRVGPGRCGVTEVAWLCTASLERLRTRCRPCLAGAPHSRSATCGRGPDDGAFTARANGWEPARQDPAGRLPADDRPGRSPCRVPRRCCLHRTVPPSDGACARFDDKEMPKVPDLPATPVPTIVALAESTLGMRWRLSGLTPCMPHTARSGERRCSEPSPLVKARAQLPAGHRCCPLRYYPGPECWIEGGRSGRDDPAQLTCQQ